MNQFKIIVSELQGASKCNQDFMAENYIEILRKLAEKSTFTEFLTSIASDNNHLKKIALQSYSHQNLFSKLILFTDYDFGWRLRMHIWWQSHHKENQAGLESDIHNHAWDFASVIISGGIVHRTYQKEKFGEIYYAHQYCIDNTTCASSLIFTGEEKLALVEEKIYQKGDVYALSKDKLHSVLPNDELTITVLVQEIGKKNSSDVFKKRISPYENMVGCSGKLLAKNQIQAMIYDVIGTL